MGLPSRWEDDEHGLCLTYWAAIAFLTERGLSGSKDGAVLVITQAEGPERRVQPVNIPAVGLMYPVAQFDSSTTTR